MRLDEHDFFGIDLAFDHFARFFELRLVVTDQKTHQNIRIDSQHQRDICSTDIVLRPFL